MLDRRNSPVERHGHGRFDRPRLVQLLRRRLGVDDGRDDAAGRGPAISRFVRADGRLRAVPQFVGSYIVVWTLVGLAVYALYRPHSTSIAGVLVIAAGAYELTAFKRDCRRRCRESVSSGTRFGLYCVGSSIGLMVMLVALGAMSVIWMAVVAAVVFAQKLLPPKASIDVPLALAVVGLGALILVAPATVPGLTPTM
jgi:predicted metal-binding membrane protein